MKRTILAVAALAAVALAPSAHAQVSNPIHVGVSGGASFPVSNPVEFHEGGFDLVAKSKVGYNVAGHLGFMVPLFPVGLRADVGYNKFEGKDLDLGGATGRADVGTISGTLNAMFKPTGMMPAKPYLIGGVGAYRVKYDLIDNSGSPTMKNTKTSFGLNGGAGVNFSLGELSTFLEARYHYVFNEEKCGATASDTCVPHKQTTFVPVSFGIMF